MSSPTPGGQDLVTGVSVRPMRESELPVVTDICRIAFATFLRMPDPQTFWADRDYTGTRWRANPGAALVAEVDGALAGSNFATNWGSFAFFGPLTIRPELWDRGIAKHLLVSTMDLFDAWGAREAGLFTFAQSAKHVGLYQKFGFWPRFLTAVMSKAVGEAGPVAWTNYSALEESEQSGALKACRDLTDSVFEGLDVSLEIASVQSQRLGDTVLIWGADSLEAFAVCHCGERTEAGAGSCYVKFAAVRPGGGADEALGRLLTACEELAGERGLRRSEAGVTLARSQAYRAMLRNGFRTDMQGVAMQRSDSAGFNRADVFVVDDWR